jgi:hypothetical protein
MKELPSLKIQDANVTQKQKTLQCNVMNRCQTSNNFVEWEKRDKDAI